jgi:hypothetical protein
MRARNSTAYQSWLHRQRQQATGGKREINKQQRVLYLDLAGQAYAVAVDPEAASRDPGQVIGDPSNQYTSHQSPVPSLSDWRREECRYATGGRSFSDGLDNDQLTRALTNFRSWISHGARASEEQMLRAVNRHRVEALRPLWDAISPSARITAMRNRFKIVVLEEAELFGGEELRQLRWTLERLAKDNPKQVQSPRSKVTNWKGARHDC